MQNQCISNHARGLTTFYQISGSNTAVMVGSFTADYQQMTFRDPDFRHSYAATGVDPGIISNRIGNVFDLKEPRYTFSRLGTAFRVGHELMTVVLRLIPPAPPPFMLSTMRATLYAQGIVMRPSLAV